MATMSSFCSWVVAIVATLAFSVCIGIDMWKYPCSASKYPNNSVLPFCDTSLSFEERAYDLVYNRYSLEELINLTVNGANSIPRYHISKYQWWNDAEHGVADSPGLTYGGPIKSTTMFAQTIGTGSTLNRTLWHSIGTAISSEFRALFNNNQSCLTIWSPNINIFRDPRWGRGQETAGEDPFVNGQYSKYWVSGMQGDNDKYLKTSATCKHFAGYSFENYYGVTRHTFNAIITDYDLNDTYFPAFKACVSEGKASSIMCSYNEVNGVPSCANKWLLTDIARNEWGFNGYIVSDCSAVENIPQTHKYTLDNGETCSVVYKAGMDIECGDLLRGNALKAVESGELDESDMRMGIYRATLVQMRMGFFDPPKDIPWANYDKSQVCSDEHLRLCLEGTRQSIVLLKNLNDFLPLTPNNDDTRIKKKQNKEEKQARMISSVAVIGPNADNTNVMKGNYYGTAPFIYTVRDGIEAYISTSNVTYNIGCAMDSNSTSNFNTAMTLASEADLTVLVMGLDESQEAEGRDRHNLSFPGMQSELIDKVSSVAKHTILVILSGGCVDVSSYINNAEIDAMIWGGYSGMYGGLAIADIIFGTFNPTARLTQTWYKTEYTDKVSMFDMGMRPNGTFNPGRGYRYYDNYNNEHGAANLINYPFGYGLSFTQFECGDLNNENDNVFSVNVMNVGQYDGGGVVMLYFIPNNAGVKGTPLKRLVGFERFNMLEIGHSVTVNLELYTEFIHTDDYRNNLGTYKLGGICDINL